MKPASPSLLSITTEVLQLLSMFVMVIILLEFSEALVILTLYVKASILVIFGFVVVLTAVGSYVPILLPS